MLTDGARVAHSIDTVFVFPSLSTASLLDDTSTIQNKPFSEASFSRKTSGHSLCAKVCKCRSMVVFKLPGSKQL